MPESIANLTPQAFAQQQAPQEVPAELIPLPSSGKVYPAESVLHNATTVGIRAMTAKEEDILTSRALLKSGRAIPTLLQSCVVDRRVDVGEMLAGDRNAVLIGIRITGYGPEYKVGYTCSACERSSEREVDLRSLPIKRFPKGVEPTAPGKNEFVFKLPVSGKLVAFKLMTGNDEQEFMDSVEVARKKGLAEELVTTRLRIQVLSIENETDKGKLATMIRNLPAKDSRALRQHIDDITPGVNLKADFECAACGNVDKEVEVPLGTEFFWPAS